MRGLRAFRPGATRRTSTVFGPDGRQQDVSAADITRPAGRFIPLAFS
ncbi:hypothetical protein [Kitasatospora sp. MAP5-34]|nr:hypothetical protein [Kitasatospora sp. MAP5-34]MDH6574560.1 hypothetical protein [Kitasatospora sp. MAP5-34]